MKWGWTPITIRCLKCLETGLLEITLKKRQSLGHGNYSQRFIKLIKKTFTLRFLKEMKKMVFREIRNHIISGRNGLTKTVLSKPIKMIIFGKWEKWDLADLALKFM